MMPAPSPDRAARPRALASLARLLVLLAAGAGPLWLAAAAHAQGTSGALPDPISGDDLTAYARTLRLSDEQMLALDRFHERYLGEFRRLREREIERFLDDTGGVVRSLLFAADSERLKKATNELDRLMKRIRAVDERMFDEVESILTEEQAQELSRVRARRSRARSLGGIVRFVGFVNPGIRVDLGALLDGIGPDAADQAAADPLLRPYEVRLTAAGRKLYEEAQSMLRETGRRLEGLANEGRDGPPRWRQMREIWSETGRRTVAQAAAISALNRRTFHGLAGVLSEDVTRRLRAGYEQHAYPDVHRGAARALGRFDAALRLGGLAAEQLNEIEARRADLERRHEAIAERMIDIIEGRRAQAELFGGWAGRRRPEETKLEELRRQQKEINETALTALAALLGPDRSADFERAARDETRTAKAFARFPAAGGSRRTSRFAPPPTASGRGGADPTAAGPDPFVPGPITARELDGYADLLRLAPEDRGVAESLHGDYLEAYEALRETHVEPIVETARTMWALDPVSGRITPPALDDIDRLYDLRRRAFDAVSELDLAFLDDVELSVVSPDDADAVAAMLRVRLARARTVTNRTAARPVRFGYRPGPRPTAGDDRRESSIDLSLVIGRVDLDEDDRRRAEPVLMGYEQAIADVFRQRHETRMTHEEKLERIGAQPRAGAEAGNAPAQRQRWTAYRELRETTGRALEELDRRVVELNRGALEQLLASLDEPGAAAARRAYRRASHPDIYDDDAALEPWVRRILTLDDISEGQRIKINDLFAEYRGPYEDATERMADSREAYTRGTDDGDTGARWQRRRGLRDTMEKLRFERTELNDKGLRRLRAILTDEQAARAGL